LDTVGKISTSSPTQSSTKRQNTCIKIINEGKNHAKEQIRRAVNKTADVKFFLPIEQNFLRLNFHQLRLYAFKYKHS